VSPGILGVVLHASALEVLHQMDLALDLLSSITPVIG
jgi:hypothetical protein